MRFCSFCRRLAKALLFKHVVAVVVIVIVVVVVVVVLFQSFEVFHSCYFCVMTLISNNAQVTLKRQQLHKHNDKYYDKISFLCCAHQEGI
jgi:hypothetical protein